MRPPIILLILSILVSCSGEAQIFPDENWATHPSPALAGWGETERTTFNRYIIDSTQITGLVIVHKGQVVFEYGDIEENSYIASCRKSVLAILYGKYVQNGQIRLDKTLAELNIEDHSPLLEIEKVATIQDIISARSGIFLPGSNGGDFRRLAPERGSVEPGNYWLYSNWDFNLAGHIFEQETGRDIYDEIEVQLVGPLHMQDWDRSLQQKSGNLDVSKYPAYHMWFSTRDMARIGLMMLTKGQWRDTQVIPEDWVEEMIMQRTSYQEAQRNAPVLKEDGLDLGYGYMWWLIENTEDRKLRGAYSAQGALGQNITVYPEVDVVLAYKTKSDYRRRNSIQTQMKVIRKAVDMYNPNE